MSEKRSLPEWLGIGTAAAVLTTIAIGVVTACVVFIDYCVDTIIRAFS